MTPFIFAKIFGSGPIAAGCAAYAAWHLTHGSPYGVGLNIVVAAFAVLSLADFLDGLTQLARKKADTPTEADIVARWQKTRERLYRRAYRHVRWDTDIMPGDREIGARRLSKEWYDKAAGDARARGEWAPTYDQLRRPAEGDNPWHL